MADEKGKWAAVFGPVAFINEAQLGAGGPGRRVAVTVPNSEGKKIQCTLWPKFNDVKLEQGDWIGVEGPLTPYNTKDKQDNPVTYWNLSVQRLTVVKMTSGNKPGEFFKNNSKSQEKSETLGQSPF